jgi:hypothetical protein
MATDDADLMSTRTVGNYFGRSSRTVERWQVDPELNFAQPMVIRGRKYWPRGEVRAWELAQLASRVQA